ncbi:MAG: succinate dehydrogenase, cytochrome b subunit [Pseudomonadota bacterium]
MATIESNARANSQVRSLTPGPRTPVANSGYRRNVLWHAAFIHRMSGVLLAIFLPMHFLVLGLAIEGEAALGGFIAWTELPVVKLAESVLVFLLAVHLLGGLRVLAIENAQVASGHRRLAIIIMALSATAAVLFLLMIWL